MALASQLKAVAAQKSGFFDAELTPVAVPQKKGEPILVAKDEHPRETSLEALAKCIRLCLDCADICGATGRVVSRQTEYDANVTRAILQACEQACRSCGEECAKHGEHGMEHCAVCAEQCRRCEQACADLLQAIS